MCVPLEPEATVMLQVVPGAMDPGAAVVESDSPFGIAGQETSTRIILADAYGNPVGANMSDLSAQAYLSTALGGFGQGGSKLDVEMKGDGQVLNAHWTSNFVSPSTPSKQTSWPTSWEWSCVCYF